jgi:hypothetical protein
MIDRTIVCSFLYVITKYGYPPSSEESPQYLAEMKTLGFQSVELEGIRRDHLLGVYDRRAEIAATVELLDLQVPFGPGCRRTAGASGESGPLSAGVRNRRAAGGQRRAGQCSAAAWLAERWPR